MGIASDDYSACDTYERNEEETRVERWHATYNAALTGLYALRSDSKDPRHHEIDLDARLAASIMHGALKP